MNLAVKRIFYTEQSIIGALYIEDVFECYTLELPEARAIPIGVYKVAISLSKRFNRLMPRVLNVPGRTNIEIHWGNTAADTEGCILVGETQSQDFIGCSKVAFEKLYDKLTEAVVKKEDLDLVITDTREYNVV